ncbi:MAG TPA: hypothetical protein VMW09_05900 [Desulfatiglandales bacterium]|nr:hypothetical protein [Desulfatiglandales bacterium]
MKFEISISKRKTYLNIHVKEAVTPDLLKEFVEKTANNSIKSGINKFLFDLRQAPNQTSPLVHYDLVYDKSRELGFKPGSKHALLVSLENRNGYSFVETILLNAGYQSKIFTDEKDAIEWVEK